MFLLHPFYFGCICYLKTTITTTICAARLEKSIISSAMPNDLIKKNNKMNQAWQQTEITDRKNKIY